MDDASSVFGLIKNKIVLATKEDIISMYATSKIDHQTNAAKYYQAMELRRKLNWGSLKISRAINMPEGAVHYWLQGFEPKSVKGIKELERMGLLPLEVSNSEPFIQFVRTFGLRFADGCVYEQKRNNSFTGYLCFGDKQDAIKFTGDCQKAWKIDLPSHFGSKAYYVYLPASLVRLMILVGSPVGAKTLQSFNLPRWIFNLPDNLKFEFLGGIFSGDGEVPRLKHSGTASESLKLSFNSEKSIAKDFSRNFMWDLWELINMLGIKATRPTVMKNQPRLSKDGITTYPIVIRILTKRSNMIYFLSNVNYCYNTKGKEAIKNVLVALKKNHVVS